MKTWTGLDFFRSETLDRIVEAVMEEEDAGHRILPDGENWFNAFSLCPFMDTKVIILGQDPYPNPDHANGLAFSVPDDIVDLPASLENISREMMDDIGCCPHTGDLTGWAEQGVLLLNTALTVREGERGSHANLGWQGLVTEVIQMSSRLHDNMVYILWGKKAQGKSNYVSNWRNHLILRGAHPSPLAANKGGFFGTKPFSQTNEYLIEHGKEPINWCMG